MKVFCVAQNKDRRKYTHTGNIKYYMFSFRFFVCFFFVLCWFCFQIGCWRMLFIYTVNLLSVHRINVIIIGPMPVTQLIQLQIKVEKHFLFPWYAKCVCLHKWKFTIWLKAFRLFEMFNFSAKINRVILFVLGKERL